MLVKPGEHVPLAHLLQFMVLGERLAHNCAEAQCRIAPEISMQKFLAGQARQEGYHAIAFQGAIRWLLPKNHTTSPVCDLMDQYRQLLDGAMARKDFAETLVAEQIILEGMGEAILKKLEVGLVKRGAPFRRLRRTLLHQEEAHHQFGLRTLSKMIERGEESVESLHHRTHMYLPLAKDLMFSAQEAFQAIDEDPHEYWNDFYANLPEWIQTPPDLYVQLS